MYVISILMGKNQTIWFATLFHKNVRWLETPSKTSLVLIDSHEFQLIFFD